MRGQLRQGWFSFNFAIRWPAAARRRCVLIVLSPSVVTRIDFARHCLTAYMRDKVDGFGALGQRDDVA